MYIQPINNSPNFNAKLNLQSKGFADYMEYLHMCKNVPKGQFNTSKNLGLFRKICKAFEKHPSNEVINADVKYRRSELFNARGFLETSKAHIIDIEPSRSDDGTAPMENILRKILNPDNKKLFNNLLGEKHKSSYNAWWDENIKPIWTDIQETFENNDILEEISESQLNRNFRRQKDIADGTAWFG